MMFHTAILFVFVMRNVLLSAVFYKCKGTIIIYVPISET